MLNYNELNKKTKVNLADAEEKRVVEDEEYMNEQIFRPNEIAKSVSKLKIEEIVELIKKYGFLDKISSYITPIHTLYLVEARDCEIVNSIVKFRKSQDEVLTKVINNLNNYTTTKTKVDYDELKDITLNLDLEDRKVKDITKIYNNNKFLKNISESTVFKTISKKMYFKYRLADLKSHKYFECARTFAEILFIYRVVIDFNLGKKILFYDEMGMCKIPNSRKCWFFPTEKKHSAQE